jgi:hypothetical protein
MLARRSIVWLSLLVVAALPAVAQQKKPLTIVNAALLEAEGGFPAAPDTVRQPGETLYLSFHVQGYTVDRNSRVRLSYRIDALDPGGVAFVEPEEGKIDTELAPQDAKWVPRIRASPVLPPFADSGRYRLVVRVSDELGKTQVSQELHFQVRGRSVQPSDTLVARNFQFSRQEDGESLPAPAYRRGETLWAAFDITGYKGGEKNQVWVDYGLAVVNAEGKVLFQQAEPAEEKGTSFYPRRYVHAVFSLNLEAGIAAGEYAIVLNVRDRVGNQAVESRHRFTVE